MHTAAGRKLAARKASDSLKFFRALLTELRETGIASLRIRQLRIPNPSAKGRSVSVRIVSSPNCPNCGSRWDLVWTTDKGVKCHKLNVEWDCTQCSQRLETSFCLPEIVS
jgi:hypothetical protein